MLALATFVLVLPLEANAFGLERRHEDRVIHNHLYRPHYRHVYVESDPYGYRPARVGYYPYYNSNYWRPLREVRLRYRHKHVLPDYYSSWGYPLRRTQYRKHWRKRSVSAVRHYRAVRPAK